MQCTGLTFLGMATGMVLGLCTQPYWNRCGTPLVQTIQINKLTSIPKEVPQVQRRARPGRAAAGVPTPDGAGGGRAGAHLALLAGVHDVSRGALDRAGARVRPVRHWHLLHLHVLLL